jgi:hypothetical protein
MKRYFYGDTVAGPNNTRVPWRVPCLTPFSSHVAFSNVTIYKLSSVALSASLLPVSAKQSTEPVQLNKVDIKEKLQHALLAVCHLTAVHLYHKSGMAHDLYEAGVGWLCGYGASLDGYEHIAFAESMHWIATQSYIARWEHYMDGIKE